MKWFLFIFVCWLIMACSGKNAEQKVTSVDSFVRVTSNADSLKEMYVIYVSRYDSTRSMMKAYWDNGNTQSVGLYKTDKLDGRWILYTDDGKLSYEGDFINGQKSGTHKYYHSNGSIWRTEYYKLGKKTGKWFIYDSTGNLISTEEY